jgi:DNA (cytosine-5)-methyltransferase 1
VLDGLHPRAFVAENVPGMLMARALDEYAYKVVNELSALGYKVWTNVLNAASYGVPQQRRRLIFVGLRRDLGLEWEWPVPTTPVAHTFRQLMAAVPPDDPDHGPFLSDCSFVGTTNEARWNHLREARRRKAAGGQAGMYGGWTEDDVVRCQRCGEFLTQHTVTRRAKGGIAKEATCQDGGDALFPKNGFQFILPDPDEPCPTVIADGWGASGGSLAHPQEPRKLTPAECKSASSFPIGFVLSGKLKQRYERIGRAVPPKLYEAVGRQLVRTLKGEG